jgi:hypothetical protein
MTVEEHTESMRQMIGQMAPKVLMYMVHNGHMAEPEWEKVGGWGEVLGGKCKWCPSRIDFSLILASSPPSSHAIKPKHAHAPPQVKSLASTEVPVLTLAPHVTASLSNRSLPVEPDWILPIFPFDPPSPCTLDDLTSGRQCIRGFSVQGRIEKSRRNYTEVWEQIGGHRKHHTSSTVSNFKLNILGETVEAFSVPGGWCKAGRLGRADWVVGGFLVDYLHLAVPHPHTHTTQTIHAQPSILSTNRSRGPGPRVRLQEPPLPHLLRRRVPQLWAGESRLTRLI